MEDFTIDQLRIVLELIKNNVFKGDALEETADLKVKFVAELKRRCVGEETGEETASE